MTQPTRYTPDGMYALIQRVMRDKTIPADEAIPFVVADLASDPDELVRWWKALGTFWLKATESAHWGDTPTTAVMGRWAPAAPAPAPATSPTPTSKAEAEEEKPEIELKPKRGSWREGVTTLDLVLPVGSTGELKRLGSWTRADVLANRAMYIERGQKLIEDGERWGRLGELMEPDEMLEHVLLRVRHVQINVEQLPVELRGAIPVVVEQEQGENEAAA